MKTKVLSLLAILSLTATMGFAQRIRVVHASPDAPAVDVYVDSAKAVEALPFGDYTDYIDVPLSQIEYSIFVSGTDTKVTSGTLFVDTDLTIIASGFAGGGTPAFGLTVLRDSNRIPAVGKARVRVVHAAPSAPAVDVYFTSPYGALSIPVLTGVPFGVGSGYLTVNAGMKEKQYQARVTVADTKTVAIDSGRLLVPSESVRTYVAIDPMEECGAFQIIELLDAN
jgi:uncharacterized protein DUF4397